LFIGRNLFFFNNASIVSLFSCAGVFYFSLQSQFSSRHQFQTNCIYTRSTEFRAKGPTDESSADASDLLSVRLEFDLCANEDEFTALHAIVETIRKKGRLVLRTSSKARQRGGTIQPWCSFTSVTLIL
jgi:hypothetical protein